MSQNKCGQVYLVGAGCGDPDYLTLAAKKALENCTAVVYDALINPVLLEYCTNAKRYYVGKRAANHALSQDEINALLVELSRSGETVVRLKGGDPFVFGRGGEEGEFLYDHQVNFSLIPGITSAIGGLEAAGIPITHRECNQAFAVITGHMKEGSSDLNWDALARFEGTLVFLMGVKNLENITSSLIQAGKDPETPAALVHAASTPDQYTIRGNLETLAERAREACASAPALIVIGDVVEHQDKLDFKNNRTLYPLRGKNIMITRARAQASSLREKLENLGAQVYEVPTIRIEADQEEMTRLKQALKALNDYTDLIFTSVNGVQYFFDTLDALGYDSRKLSGLRISVIGSGTEKALSERGIHADLVPERFVAESLAEALKPLLDSDSRVLVPRAKEARAYLKEELENICPVDEYKIYKTLVDEESTKEIPDIFAQNHIDALTFTSSSTVKNFLKSFKNIEDAKEALSDTACVVIGPQTAKTLVEAGLSADRQAEVYTIDGLIDAVIEELN